jgi:hypothetical protein
VPRDCPYDNPDCPNPGKPPGFGDHARCLEIEVERARSVVKGTEYAWWAVRQAKALMTLADSRGEGEPRPQGGERNPQAQDS